MALPSARGLRDLAALGSLANPTRRRLYAVVVQRGRPVGRDEAAAAVGISRALSAYHLDKLAESGLLAVEYARAPGRDGPGAGRPAKLYRQGEGEFALRVAPPGYDLLAQLLHRVAADDQTGAARASILRAAAGLGERLGASGASLDKTLRDSGYEPAMSKTGVIRLRNCPFASTAARCPDIVCALNLALIRGILAGSGAKPELATRALRTDGRCVELTVA